MFNPFRLIKRIVYALLLIALAFVVINYKAMTRFVEYYLYQKYPKAEIIQVILRETPPKEGEIPEETTLVISKIGVRVPVVEVENAEENTIQKGLESGVVHYPGTANPGEQGNFFVLGHSSDYVWRAGDYKDVFALLNKLERDDQVKVYYQGQEYLYEVRDKLIISPNQVDVLQPTEEPTLTLMTCWPIGTPLKRLVVRADLIKD